MLPYFVLLAVWMIGAMQFSSRLDASYERIFYGAALISTILIVGLRYQVGGDWIAYEEMYASIAFLTFTDAMTLTDPAYAFLNWLSAKLDWGVYLPNLVCATVFMLGLSTLVRKQARPWLAMTVAIPYLVIVVGMGYTRQAAAIGVICWAIATVGHDKVWKIVAKVAFAALFHKTAILFLPILLAPIARRNALTGIVGSLAFLILAVVLLRGSSDELVANYVTSDYQSGGAAVRVAMNVVAAALFFVFRKEFAITPHERLVWSVMAGLAIVSAAGLAASASSVGVDRVALFLIPLQVFVYGNLPRIPVIARKSAVSAVFAVMAYSVAVQYVYFFHGTFSYTWLPYRNAIVAGDDDGSP